MGVHPLLQLCDHDYRTRGTCCGLSLHSFQCHADCRSATWWLRERMEGDMNVSDMKASQRSLLHSILLSLSSLTSLTSPSLHRPLHVHYLPFVNVCSAQNLNGLSIVFYCSHSTHMRRSDVYIDYRQVWGLLRLTPNMCVCVCVCAHVSTCVCVHVGNINVIMSLRIIQ